MRRSPLRRLRRWLGLWLLAGTAALAADEVKPELRGILQISQRVVFCIRLPARTQNVWISPGQPLMGITIVSHDLRRNTVTIEFQGRTHVLVLPEGKVKNGGDSPDTPASDGTNLVPPSSIRDAIRNRALSAEEIKPWVNTPWFQDFIKQHPEAAPPVVK